MMRANGQYNDYLDGQLKAALQIILPLSPARTKNGIFAPNRVKKGLRANSTVFDQNIPDFW